MKACDAGWTPNNELPDLPGALPQSAIADLGL